MDILRNAQASSSVRLCDSMVTPIKEIPASARIVIFAVLRAELLRFSICGLSP